MPSLRKKGGGSGPGGDLEDLDDVIITSPSNGQVIEYDVGIWKNVTPSGISRTLVLKTGEYIAHDLEVVLCDATISGFQVTLPALGNGVFIDVKKTDASANIITIIGSGIETIDGAANFLIESQWESYTFISDGSNWFVI